MTLKELFELISWDIRINRGVSFDSIRAKLMLLDIRYEQFIYRNIYRPGSPLALIWYLVRFCGSIFQWFFCNSNIPGSTTIGKGLRLPHPQNIIMAGFADVGEFCTIYHNVSIAWNGFKPVKPHSPRIGNQVLLGTGAILVGDICIGSDVLIGAGAVVTRDVPDHSRVTCARSEMSERMPSDRAAEVGSPEHLRDPYSIWR
jgi:putative colanic acid biosynthesis acetyltransferase WcaB